MSHINNEDDPLRIDWQPPDDIVRAAYSIDEWMQKMGCEEWQLGPCASRKGYLRLERELKAARSAIAIKNEALRSVLFRIDNYLKWAKEIDAGVPSYMEKLPAGVKSALAVSADVPPDAVPA